MSKVTVKYAHVRQPIEEVTLRLTEDEAHRLRTLLGRVRCHDGLHDVFEELANEIPPGRFHISFSNGGNIKIEEV